MAKAIVIFLTILLLPVLLLAQADDLMKQAQKSYSKNDYYTAIPLYQQVVKYNPKDVKAWAHLGDALYKVRDHQEAVVAFANLLKLLEKGHKNAHYKSYFQYGNSLMAVQQYDLSRKIFLEFLRLKPMHADYREMKRMANAKIKACQIAKEMTLTGFPDEYTVQRLPEQVNSSYSDFAPVWISDQNMLFSSMRSDTLLTVDETELHPHLNKLYLTKRENGHWHQPEPFGEFNQELSHTANGTFSADGKTFIYSVCQENPAHEVRCALYMAKKEKDQWQAPAKLKNGINLNSATSTQPALGRIVRRGSVSEVLYFASNRHGGRGGMDIWYSVKNNKGEWDHPVNCGSAINTTGNEITPYYNNESSELYFSSDYHYGLGGYDIFSAYGGLKSWRSPENMGAGVNTGFDDTYFSWRVPQVNGSLVSNREGSVSVFGNNCCDDIFYIERENVHELPGIAVLADSMHIRLSDVTIGRVLSGNLTDTDSIRQIGVTDGNGGFILRYLAGQNPVLYGARDGFETSYIQVVDSLGNYPDTIVIAMERNLQWREKLDKIGYQGLEILTKESLATDVKKGTVLVLEHIYFDFNKSEIKPEAYQDLNLLENYMKKHPTAKIEIAGHTDSKGNARHNHNLSQRRAEAIRQHLISTGIKASRLVAVGYGEDKPIAPNENEDGTDNPEGRKLNRRTEVIILEE